MKTRNIILLFTTLLLLAGCGVEYTIKTRIFADGSCERIMTSTFASTEKTENPFFIPIDSTWDCDTSQEERVETTFGQTDTVTYITITVRKKFPDIASMHAEFLPKDKYTEHAVTGMELKRKFRWFHTFYTYREIFEQRFPFKKYELSEYLKPLERSVYLYEDSLAIAEYYSGKDSTETAQMKKDLEKKTDAFITKNIIGEFLDILDSIVHAGNGHPVYDTLSIQDKRAEFEQILESRIELIGKGNDTSARGMMISLDQGMHTDVFRKIYENNQNAYTEFDKKLQLDYLGGLLDIFSHQIEMPGKLVSANTRIMKSGIPEWQYGHIHFAFEDYVMEASSVKVNLWAYILSGLIILAGIYLSVLRNRKSGKQ